jgi:HEAT repeat protein
MKKSGMQISRGRRWLHAGLSALLVAAPWLALHAGEIDRGEPPEGRSNAELVQSLAADPQGAAAREIQRRLEQSDYSPQSEIVQALFTDWLTESDEKVRFRCLSYLAKANHAGAQEILIQRLAGGNPFEERRSAIRMLPVFKNQKSIEALESFVAKGPAAQPAQPEQDLARGAILALSEIGDSAFPAVWRLYQDQNAFKRYGGDLLAAVGWTAPPSAVEPLIERWKSSDQNARPEIMLALGDIGKRHAQAREKTTALALEALRADDPALREKAAQALGKIHAKDAIPVLEAVAARDSYSRELELAVHGTTSTVPGVYYPVRDAAQSALARLRADEEAP